eukprot:Rhum_TRINITY_DN2803_c0_g1::Rhum_TRINITY_DN2803_c0_g1_i1::g.8463::m.8463
MEAEELPPRRARCLVPGAGAGTRNAEAFRTLEALDSNVARRCFSYLAPEDLLAFEQTCTSACRAVEHSELWEQAFDRRVREEGWRRPTGTPCSWKLLLHQYEKEVNTVVVSKLQYSSCTVYWRVPLPDAADDEEGGARQRSVDAADPAAECWRTRSREFPFSYDAEGAPIYWQMEVSLVPPAAASQMSEDSWLAEPAQPGLLRIWTTNPWTQETARRYYGAYCTVSLRDSTNCADISEERHVDIDACEAFTFATSQLQSNKELVVKVNLTLALEIPAPLNPYFELVGLSSLDSDLVKIGYCKAMFEIARCKRNTGATFARACDRNIELLVAVVKSRRTCDYLKIEVFQALFNLLGPTSVLLEEDVVMDLLHVCATRFSAISHQLHAVEVAPSAVLMTQNVLGNVFNLLGHPSARYILASPHVLCDVAALLSDPHYGVCTFSVLVILLTVRSWGSLPPEVSSVLELSLAQFMARSDPLDSEVTGVAWDESDIAGFFLPLLLSKDLLCVSFVSWCLNQYYFTDRRPDTFTLES